MDKQRLRNLTTRILHTEIGHVYEDLECIIGEKGIMTHMIPNALRAIKPYLMEKISEERFWDERFDTGHSGEIDVPVMNAQERKEFWERYKSYDSSLNLIGTGRE